MENEEIKSGEVNNKPFKLKENTYHVKLNSEQYNRMQQWLSWYEEKKEHFKAQHPTLHEKHYENMSFIWLLGELVEIEKSNFLCRKQFFELEDKMKSLSEEIDTTLLK